MHTLLILYVGSGILLLFLALPLLAEKVPPNPIYGLRIRATLRNRTIWYKANKYAARRLIWSGVLLAASASILDLIPGLSRTHYALGCLAIFVVAMSITLIQSLRYVAALDRSGQGR